MRTQPRRIYTFGPFQLDPHRRVLLRGRKPVPLEPKVLDLLIALVQNRGRVVNKDDLMKLIWPDSFVEESNVSVDVCKLRSALDDQRRQHPYIETVPCRGYRFAAAVTEALDKDLNNRKRARPQAQAGERPALAVEVRVSSGDGVRKGMMAVLPFKLIGSGSDEYLSLGMADALITRLSNLKRMTIRSTSSVRKYNGSQDPVLAGRELGVKSVLEGSVQKRGRRVRVTAQLVNVTTGSLLWAGKFDEKFTDIFAVEDSISEQVTNALALRLTGKERRLLAKRYTENAEAYEAYLKGCYFLEKRTIEGCKKGIEYFEQAIAIDRNYALAYTGVARCCNTLNTIFPSQEWSPQAERAALRALELDGSLGEAHGSLGLVKTRQWDWLSAETEFKTATQLNPNCADARASYAVFLVELGRFDEALDEIKRARALDPLSLLINSQLGSLLYLMRRYEDALEQFRKTLELDTNFPVARFVLGNLYEVLGKYQDALREYQHSQRGLGNVPEFTTCVGRIHAFCGRTDQAFLAIEKLICLSKKCYVQPSLIALIYEALGDKDKAFQWFERGYEERDEDLCLLKVDPRLDSLRSDRRFTSLLQRVGLAAETQPH